MSMSPMKNLVMTLLFVICASPASAQKVQVGADPAIDVSKYKTYAWTKGRPLPNPLINQTIVDAVERALATKGLTKVETNAEVTVVIFAATESDLHITYPSWAPGLNSLATGIGGSAQTGRLPGARLSLTSSRPQPRTAFGGVPRPKR